MVKVRRVPLAQLLRGDMRLGLLAKHCLVKNHQLEIRCLPRFFSFCIQKDRAGTLQTFPSFWFVVFKELIPDCKKATDKSLSPVLQINVTS